MVKITQATQGLSRPSSTQGWEERSETAPGLLGVVHGLCAVQGLATCLSDCNTQAPWGGGSSRWRIERSH